MFWILWVCNLGHELLKCDTEPTFWDFAFFAFYSSLKFQSFVVSTKLLKAFQPEWSFEHERCCCWGKQTRVLKLLWQTHVYFFVRAAKCIGLKQELRFFENSTDIWYGHQFNNSENEL